MKRKLSNKARSSGKISAKKLILFAVSAVIVLPALYGGIMIGAFVHGCDVKMAAIDAQSTETRQKLDRLSLPMTNQTAAANGDCVTASGMGFGFNTTQSYASPLEAKNDIITRLAAAGIPAPPLTQEPTDIFALNGSSSGGNTPIKEIQLSYDFNGGDYDFIFHLDQAIPCEVVSIQQVFCGGEDKDTLVKKLIANQPISSTDLNGSIRHE